MNTNLIKDSLDTPKINPDKSFYMASQIQEVKFESDESKYKPIVIKELEKFN